MEIRSPSGHIYVIGNELGHTEKFRFYQCTAESSPACILKIARQAIWNGLLDREAFILQLLAEGALELESEYEKVKENDKKLNYHFFFPKIIETFIAKEQENSRISIMSFAHLADNLSELTPLSHLISRENVYVDPRTSAWIMGKLLTLINFIQGEKILINDLSGDNIFINRREHYVTIFDWTGAALNIGGVSKYLIADRIAQIAKGTIRLLGGNPTTKKLPESPQLIGNNYEAYLAELSAGKISSAKEAHQRFYDLVLSAWPREFYQFTTIKKED